MIGWSHDRQRLLIWIELEVLPKYVDFIEIDFEKTLPGWIFAPEDGRNVFMHLSVDILPQKIFCVEYINAEQEVCDQDHGLLSNQGAILV